MTANALMTDPDAVASALRLLNGLSPAQVRRLARRPDAVRAALLGLLGETTDEVSQTPRFTLKKARGPARTLKGAPPAKAPARAAVEKAMDAASVADAPLDAAGLFDDPDMLSSEDFANETGVSRQTVNGWRKEGRVIGLETNRKGFRYPRGQLDSHNRPYAAIADILDVFGSHWSAWSWLTAPHAGFAGATPLEALAEGDDAAVIAAASNAGGDFA